MKINIQQYVDSGALEAYILGAATEAEEQQIRHLQNQYPEVKYALKQLEDDVENMAQSMAIAPPPGTWDKIEDGINSLIVREKTIPDTFNKPGKNHYSRKNNGQQYIEVEAESSHMKIHKNWKWIFAAVFILGKIFLIGAIYFYLENRQAQQQILELKQEMQGLRK